MTSMLDYFQMEAAERLEQLSTGLIELEDSPRDQTLVSRLFREAHSLKGAAAVTGLADVSHVCHLMEDLLSDVRDGTTLPDSQLIDKLLSATDGVEQLIAAELGQDECAVSADDIVARLTEARSSTSPSSTSASLPVDTGNLPNSPPTDVSPPHKRSETDVPDAAPIQQALESSPVPLVQTTQADDEAICEPSVAKTPREPEPATHSKTSDTVRLRIDSLDTLANLTGELFVAHDRLRQRLDTIRQTYHAVRAVRDRHAALDDVSEQLHPIAESIRHLADELADDLTAIEPLVVEIHDRVLETRMLPLSILFDNLPRFVRDSCRHEDKDVALRVEGADTRVDRHVLEELRDPVTQLVRNAIGHGIEAPDERERLGKPRSGSVRLITSRRGDRIRIVCEDDGRGIDRQKVVDRAIAVGLVSSRDAAALSTDQIDRFILTPGLSTADAVTDVCGRGVGMDVVASRIELLHGTLHVESEPGRFTRIVLELPASVATLDGLVVDVAEHTYVIPTSLVESADRIAPSQLQRGVGGEVLAPWQGRPIPVLSLTQLLGCQPAAAPPDGPISVVVMRHRGQPIALAADRLRTTQTVVAKNLADELGNLCGVTGATILSSGVPALILDPAQFLSEQIDYTVGNDLIEDTADVVEETAPFLIVDDSVTTRMMEKSILESAGYQVELAVSAENALQKATHRAYRLFVVDVEMPGMNGFELTRKLRQNPNYAETPVIIVSSLSSDDQRREGLEAGANAYIVKGEFDQNTLLDTIERLVGS